MSEVLTWDEIEAQFDGEWVLLEDPVLAPGLEIKAGKVLWHSKDRDEVYRKAFELQPRRPAILYLGRRPEGTEILL